jgi:hypothetical protein
MVLILACLIAGTLAFAQENAAAYAKAGLSEAERQKVEAIYQKLALENVKSQADVKVAEATVERLLVEAQPDMAQVEKALRAGYEAQLKARLARIKAEVEVRQAIGDKKWVVLRKFARTLKDLSLEEKKDIVAKKVAAAKKAQKASDGKAAPKNGK